AALPFGPATTAGVGRSGSTSADANAAYDDGSRSGRSMKCLPLATVEDGLRGRSFRLQHRPIGNLAVPLDQCRDRTTLPDDDLVQLPHRVRDRPVMAVDQEPVAFIVSLLGVAGEMDLADAGRRKGRRLFRGGESGIGGGNE